MRLKLIACKALYREISLISATCESFIDVTYLRQGLHDTPDLLRDVLIEEIKMIDAGEDVHTFKSQYINRDFDAILLGYGLCANGIIGVGSQKYPIVVPRAHDCITLYLGAKEKYQEYFDAHGGTFWYNASWIENGFTPSEQSDIEMLEIYTERYGEDNAKYLMDLELTENYDRCAYVKWEELLFPHHEQYARDAAKYRGWEFELVNGDSSLLRDFLEGRWDEDRFVTALPGKKFSPDYSGGIISIE